MKNTILNCVNVTEIFAASHNFLQFFALTDMFF